MLQYTVQPFPLPTSPPPKQIPTISPKDKDTSTSRSSNDRLHQRGGVFRNTLTTTSRRPSYPDSTSAFSFLPHPHAIPLSISTNNVYPSCNSDSPILSDQIPPSPLLPPPVHKYVPRSPYMSSPRPTSSPVPRYPLESPDSPRPPARRFSTTSSGIQDILSPGDLVGEGLDLEGELIRRVPGLKTSPTSSDEQSAREFEVVRRLGTGSYAVVYLVKEVLSRTVPSDSGHGHVSAVGSIDLDWNDSRSGFYSAFSGVQVEYGRQFAIKCLSKANLDEEALAAQMSEVTIHQSLPAHPNIVTLHRTLETPSYLLLLLEFVPGEDLFYFLEQARDHYAPTLLSTPSSPLSTPPPSPTHASQPITPPTPPTPGLLSSHNPTTLLSKTRLKLIASMFSQMCDAVAACHDVGVYHRDIKPENFIVTDGWVEREDPAEGRDRKVVVKLTDFGLSTRDWESSDMDCGSAPYMSYECRNNIAPTYLPRGADVWSLGIVLINMLYHFNPWTDTTEGACSSFALFRQQPITFLLARFPGMTAPVAEFLADNVFCILDDARDDAQRVSARAFGRWARDLPALLAPDASGVGHRRVVSVGEVHGHPISSVPHSRRPSSRQASLTRGGLASRAPSFGLAEGEEPGVRLAAVLDVDEPALELLEEQEQEQEADVETASRSTSTTKRRKRGARKGKGAHVLMSQSSFGSATAAGVTPGGAVGGVEEEDRTLETLATASQSLARELSRSSKATLMSSYLTSPTDSYSSLATTIPPVPPVPLVSKKASKWKLGFGKTTTPVLQSAEHGPETESSAGSRMSATASNVTSLIMGLEAPSHNQPCVSDRQETWTRGRRPPPTVVQANASNNNNTWSPSSASPLGPNSSHISIERWAHNVEKRAVSPTSTRSGRPLASSASSTASSNWRSSMSTSSSAGTSTSAFTKYSNGSTKTVSTMATSVSSESWRNPVPVKPQAQSQVGGRSQYGHDVPRAVPANIKVMSGVPWELNELPRQLHPNPVGDIFGSPPVRKARTRQPKNTQLDTISERPNGNQKTLAVHPRQDASTSTTDLNEDGSPRDDAMDGSPKKVQKGQINALAKMLSALRR